MKNRFYSMILCLMTSACSVKESTTDQPMQINFLRSPSQANSAEPFLFTDKNDHVYLSWVEKEEENSTFKFSKLANGQWSDPITIASGNTWFVNWADYPMMATYGKQSVAHFLDKSGEGTYAYDVKLTTSVDNGVTWTDPITLHDDNEQAEHGFVTIIPYENNFFVTWLDGRNTLMEGMESMDHHGHPGAMSLRAAILDANGDKINEWELDSKTCDCCQTSAAITDNGPVVIYRDRSDEEIRDMSIVRLIDNRWTVPRSIHADNWRIAGCPVNGPRVVATGNNLVAAWFSAASDTPRVNVIFSIDGGETFGEPIRVDEGKAIGRVDVVLVNNKTAIVSWMEGGVLKAAKVNSDGTKEPSITIASSSEARSSGFPQMTKSGNQVIFAWTDDKEKNIKVASINL